MRDGILLAFYEGAKSNRDKPAKRVLSQAAVNGPNRAIAALVSEDDSLYPEFCDRMEVEVQTQIVSWLSENIKNVSEKTKSNLVLFLMEDAMTKRTEQLRLERERQSAIIEVLNDAKPAKRGLFSWMRERT